MKSSSSAPAAFRASRQRALNAPANFRLIPIDGPTEHVGLRKVSVHRAMDDPDTWEVFIAAKNYGAVPRSVPMTVAFGGSPVATHRFELEARRRRRHAASASKRAPPDGWKRASLHRTLSARTAAPFSNCRRAASCRSPSIPPSPIFCGPFSLRFPASKPAFFLSRSYKPDATAASSCWIILRRLRRPPRRAFGWSRPPTNRPFRSRSTGQKVKLNQWQADHPLGAGLRARDIELASAEIFRPAPGDIVVARSDAGR